ncbi:MAG: CinA family protein [Actinomycetales bacterium]|nr:CinA family protein [Actinomycetales bacterium]
MSKAEHALALLGAAGIKLAVAESLTGGLLASTIVDVPGASKVFLGGVVAYATEAKGELLWVRTETLSDYGAVSAETAAAMAKGVRKNFEAVAFGLDATKLWTLATTGVAGPDEQEGKPVGRVYVALCTGSETVTRQMTFSGDRAAIREAAVEAALDLVLEQFPA